MVGARWCRRITSTLDPAVSQAGRRGLSLGAMRGDWRKRVIPSAAPEARRRGIAVLPKEGPGPLPVRSRFLATPGRWLARGLGTPPDVWQAGAARLAPQSLLVGAVSAGQADRNVPPYLESFRARTAGEYLAPVFRHCGRGAKDRFGVDPERRPNHGRSEVAVPRAAQVFHRRLWYHLHRVGQGRSHQQHGDVRGAGQHRAEVLRESREGIERLGGNRPRHTFAVPHRGNHADQARVARSCGRLSRPGFLFSKGEQDPSAHERGESAVSRPAFGDLTCSGICGVEDSPLVTSGTRSWTSRAARGSSPSEHGRSPNPTTRSSAPLRVPSSRASTTSRPIRRR